MFTLHPIIYGTPCPEAEAAQQKLQSWLNELSPRQVSLLRSEFRHPERSATKPMTRKAKAQIETLTGYCPGRKQVVEAPDWGLAIRA